MTTARRLLRRLARGGAGGGRAAGTLTEAAALAGLPDDSLVLQGCRRLADSIASGEAGAEVLNEARALAVVARLIADCQRFARQRPAAPRSVPVDGVAVGDTVPLPTEAEIERTRGKGAADLTRLLTAR